MTDKTERDESRWDADIEQAERELDMLRKYMQRSFRRTETLYNVIARARDLKARGITWPGLDRTAVTVGK